MDGGTGGADGSADGSGGQTVTVTGQAVNGLSGVADGAGSGLSFLSDGLAALDAFSPETNIFGLGLDGVSSAPNSAFSDSSDSDNTFFSRLMKVSRDIALNQVLQRAPENVQQVIVQGRRGADAISQAQQGNYGSAALSALSMFSPIVAKTRGLANTLTAINSLSQPTSAEGIAEARQPGVGRDGASTAQSGQSMENILQGLAGLYMGNRYIKNMNNQYNTLSGMYGQDSPYAQTMRQRLERRDAASGRRSQYGPREVELQAALAGQYGQNAGMIQGLNNNITQARMQQLMMLNKMLGGRQGIQDIFGGLQGLFGGGGSANDWFQGGQGLEATLGDWGG